MRRRLTACMALLLALNVSAAEIPEFHSGEPVVIDMPEILRGQELRVFVGNTDYTALISIPQQGLLSINTSVAPLPPGQHDIVIYGVHEIGTWQTISNQRIVIVSAQQVAPEEFEELQPVIEGAPELAAEDPGIRSVEPRMTLNNEGQLEQKTFGDAQADDPETFQEFSTQAGLDTQHTLGRETEIRSNFNVVGHTEREKALRFFEEEGDAPRIDLADYLVELDFRDLTLALGHTSFGEHPLLIQGVNNRGLGVRYRINDRFDVSASRQNGTTIVGYDQLLGFTSSNHHITGASLGMEMFPKRPGLLRMALTWMDGRVESENDFDVGEVTDAEESTGYGILLSSALWDQRLRFDLAWAQSRFENPEDPTLAQGDQLVPVQTETKNARSISASLDILRGYEFMPLNRLTGYRGYAERYPINLTLSVRHEEAEPLYRSLAAFVSADQQVNQVSLNGSFGVLGFGVNASVRENNIDNLPTLLSTRTKSIGTNWNYPLAILFSRDETQPVLFWPNLTYGYSQVEQTAVNTPDPVLSGFNDPSQLPDQLTRTHSLGLNWNFERVQFGWQTSYNDQNNRQVGRKKADFSNLTHSVNLSWQLLDDLGINLGFSRNRNFDREQSLRAFTDSTNLGFNWRFYDRWSYTSSLALNKGFDNKDQRVTRDLSGNAQLGYDFVLFGRNGQVFVSLARFRSRSIDNVFDFATNASTWVANSGFSLELF